MTLDAWQKLRDYIISEQQQAARVADDPRWNAFESVLDRMDELEQDQ
jgi:hypothetical protein